MNKITISLGAEQVTWLCSKLQQELALQRAAVDDLTHPLTISFYKRNDAEEIRLRRLESARAMIDFCEVFHDALIGEKGGES